MAADPDPEATQHRIHARRSLRPWVDAEGVGHAALLRGQAAEGETCEIAGIGPVPVSVVREWMSDAFLAAIVTKGEDICSVAHLGRRPTALQTTALQWRDPQCSVAGCSRTLRLEIDHRTGWAVTHTTEVDDLDRYCAPHHAQKTRDGWMLEAGTGKRRFLPPSHPDHPLQVQLARLMRRRLGRKEDPPIAS